jgi:hypothetical protein
MSSSPNAFVEQLAALSENSGSLHEQETTPNSRDFPGNRQSAPESQGTRLARQSETANKRPVLSEALAARKETAGTNLSP